MKNYPVMHLAAAVLAGLLLILTGCAMRDAEEMPEQLPIQEIEPLPLPTDTEIPEPEPEPETAPEPEPIPAETPETPAEPEPMEPEPDPISVEPEPEEPAEPAEPAEPTADEKIAQALASMTTKEKLGQLFIAAYDKNTVMSTASEYGLGAYILFAKDFETESAQSLHQTLDEIQNTSRYGVIFAVDEEGGTVTRISRFPQFRDGKFASPRSIYAASGIDGLKADTAEKTALLTSLGLNMNMAPVADISTDPADFMYDRSLGLEGDEAGDAVCAIIDAAREGGVASVVKHFPGYGSVADTHTGMAYDWRTLDELEARDLIPFARAMEDGVGAVMVSHIITAALDDSRPASVSPKVVQYLRENMGWQGVIMTDDTAMAGLLDFCAGETSGSAALEAILAGADMVCCSNWADQVPAVLAAVEDGRISEERLNESAARVLRLKLDMGLWK